MNSETPRIILASGSPRRKALLEQIGLSFEVITADVDENAPEGLSPTQVVEELARRKCDAVAGRAVAGRAVAGRNPDAFVLAADTVCVHHDAILGKPDSNAHAREMLMALNGATHEVITGVAYMRHMRQIEAVFSVKTRVTFHHLSDELIERYVASGEPIDKAGAYGIQGLGAALVKHVEGSYWNVVGLPRSEVVEVLRRELGDGVLYTQSS